MNRCELYRVEILGLVTSLSFIAVVGNWSSPSTRVTISLGRMSSEKNQIPDLASVLRTLAGLSQYQHGGHQPQNQPSQQQDTTSQRPPQQMRQAPPKTYTPPPVKVVDPATITDWSSGLRCVMKTVSNHGHVLQEVRKVHYSVELLNLLLSHF